MVPSRDLLVQSCIARELFKVAQWVFVYEHRDSHLHMMVHHAVSLLNDDASVPEMAFGTFDSATHQAHTPFEILVKPLRSGFIYFPRRLYESFELREEFFDGV